MEEPEERQKRFHRQEAVGERDGKLLVPMSPLLGGELKVLEVETDVVKHIVRKSAPSPRGWYKDKHTPLKIRPRPCYTETLLTMPYGGYCHVGCAFCYVNYGTRGYKSTLLPTINDSYPEQMDKWLSKMMVTGQAYISSFTEPFQRLEVKYHTTERLSQVFTKHGVPIFYLSRLIPPSWVEEVLLSNPYNYMQWSVSTSNPDHLRKLSPGTFRLEELQDSIRHYASLGIYTSFQINPILPGITTLQEILDLVTLIANAGGNHVIFKFVEESYPVKPLLVKRLRDTGLPGIEEFEKLFCQRMGSLYYIQQDLRLEWLKELLRHTRSLGITMSLCYEYYYNGGAGANLAPWFTTSDQCHGPAVPLHYRPASGETFQPLPGCYRKGCLYCENHGTRACDNEMLLQAKALGYKDYREIVLKGNLEGWGMAESCPQPDKANMRGCNPNLATDAELWGLPPVDDVLADPNTVSLT